MYRLFLSKMLVVCVWPPCCDVLRHVGSNLTIFKLEPTRPNMSQHGGQTHAACYAQQCCDMLRWHVAIVWPGLYFLVFIICTLKPRPNDRNMPTQHIATFILLGATTSRCVRLATLWRHVGCCWLRFDHFQT